MPEDSRKRAYAVVYLANGGLHVQTGGSLTQAGFQPGDEVEIRLRVAQGGDRPTCGACGMPTAHVCLAAVNQPCGAIVNVVGTSIVKCENLRPCKAHPTAPEEQEAPPAACGEEVASFGYESICDEPMPCPRHPQPPATPAALPEEVVCYDLDDIAHQKHVGHRCRDSRPALPDLVVCRWLALGHGMQPHIKNAVCKDPRPARPPAARTEQEKRLGEKGVEAKTLSDRDLLLKAMLCEAYRYPDNGIDPPETAGWQILVDPSDSQVIVYRDGGEHKRFYFAEEDDADGFPVLPPELRQALLIVTGLIPEPDEDAEPVSAAPVAPPICNPPGACQDGYFCGTHPAKKAARGEPEKLGEVACENPYHIKSGNHENKTCYTTRLMGEGGKP